QLPPLHRVRGDRARRLLGLPPDGPLLAGGPAGGLDVHLLAVPPDAALSSPDPHRAVGPPDALALGPPAGRAHGPQRRAVPGLLSPPRDRRVLSRLHDPRPPAGDRPQPGLGPGPGDPRAPFSPRPRPGGVDRRDRGRRPLLALPEVLAVVG